MPSSSPDESRPSQAEPCADAVVIAPKQAATPSLRQPSRAYLRNTIVRSKHSHVTLAKPKRRHREYPIEAVYQDRSSILSRSRTRGSSPSSSCHIQDEVDTTQHEKPTVSNGQGNVACPANSESAMGNNSCFLCLQRGTHQYAVVVNFAWPGRPTPKTMRRKSKASAMDTVEISFDGIRSKKEGTQVQVMQAIQDAIYQQSGRWKRWLWCYEIITAEEVKFYFDDISEGGRAPIQIIPLLADEIRKEAHKTIDAAPSSVDYDYEAACWGPPCHTKECQMGQDHGMPCIQDRLSEASIRLHGHRSQHWLKECLQKPERAQARQFLEQGLLQKSFVYQHEDAVALPVDAKGLTNSEEMRGISVNMGWNLSRMLLHLRVGSVYTLVGLAVVWLSSVLWAGHRGDWSTALAFGQLLAASLALILHHACAR